jgi:hypothetical protein
VQRQLGPLRRRKGAEPFRLAEFESDAANISRFSDLRHGDELRLLRRKLSGNLAAAPRLHRIYFVPVFRHAFVNAIGPRIAAKKWQDVFPTAITTGYAYPWEDIQLKG